MLNPGERVAVKVGPKATMLCVVQNAEGLCRSCGAEGAWVRTPPKPDKPQGSWLLVEPEFGDWEADALIAHFAKCPDRDRWRRR